MKVLAGLCVSLALLGVIPSTPALAAVAAVTGTHMATQSGPDRPVTTRFASGTTKVYFDYTVITPSSADTGRVEVYRNGTSGEAVATATLYFGIQASLYVPIARSGNTAFPDGGYCTVLFIDGQRDTAGGEMPLGWAVGPATLPKCPQSTEARLQARATGDIQTRRKSSLSVTARANGKPIGGVSLVVDGSNAGMKHIHHGTTNSRGSYVFRGLLARNAGTVYVTARKTGFQSTTLTVKVSG